MSLSPYDFMDDVNPSLSNTGVVNTRVTSGLNLEKVNKIGSFRILIDWLGFTFKADGIRVEHVLEWFQNSLSIKAENWEPGRRYYHGYADSLRFENMTIYYNGADTQGIHVDFSGQGCRYIDTIFEKCRIQNEKMKDKKSLRDYQPYLITDWHSLLALLHYSDDINITRLDIASDDFHGLIDVSLLFNKMLSGELTSRFRHWRPDGKFNMDGKTNGISLYLGSDQSDTQLTIYEKNKQLNLDMHWTRLELQFRRKRAESVTEEILNSGQSVGITFARVLKHYVKFREKGKDSNKSRWKVSPWWDELLDGLEPLKIASAMPDRTIEKNHMHLDKQYSRTLARLYFAYQDISDNWLRDLIRNGIDKLNEEDLRMIKEFKRLYEKEKEPKRIGSFVEM